MNAFFITMEKMSEKAAKHTAQTFQSFLVGSRFRAGLGRGCKVSKSKVGQSR